MGFLPTTQSMERSFCLIIDENKQKPKWKKLLRKDVIESFSG